MIFFSVHEAISRELEGHFADRIEDYQSEGMSEADAVDRAILQMGDPLLIGKELHHTHKPRVEWSLLGMIAGLIGLGLLTLSSLLDSQSLAASQFQRQILFLILGAVVLVGLLFTDYRRLLPYCRHLYAATLLLMLCSLSLIPTRILSVQATKRSNRSKRFVLQAGGGMGLARSWQSCR